MATSGSTGSTPAPGAVRSHRPKTPTSTPSRWEDRLLIVQPHVTPAVFPAEVSELPRPKPPSTAVDANRDIMRLVSIAASVVPKVRANLKIQRICPGSILSRNPNFALLVHRQVVSTVVPQMSALSVMTDIHSTMARNLCTGRTGASGGTATTCGLTCHEACESCSAASDDKACLMCSAGHFMEAPNKCSRCPDNKGKATDVIPSSTAQSSDVCATTCLPQCKLCSASASSCIGCNEGYYLSGTRTCTKCRSGTGKAAGALFLTAAESPSSCSACSTGCELCSSNAATDCMRCAAGFFRTSTGICRQCPSGKGKLADATNTNNAPFPTIGTAQCDVTCSANCILCSTTAANTCLMCGPGYFRDANGCSPCSAGTGKPADTTIQNPSTDNSGTCAGTTCNSRCTLCGSSSQSECIRCNKGYYLSATGVCSQCPAGRGKNADISDPSPNTNGNSACGNTCSPGCLLCDGSTTGLMCDKGFYFDGQGCLQCGPGTGKPADTTVQTAAVGAGSCPACHANCALCFGTNSNQCLMCNQGFYKSAANTCSRCRVGKTRATDTTETPPFASADLGCTVACDSASNCYNCQSGSTSKCLSCPQGYFLSGGPTSPVCTMCNNGKTKAADATNTITSTDVTTACVTACGSRCKACLPSDINFCLLCADNFFWTAAGTCSRCNDGRGKANEVAVFSTARLETAVCSACAGTASHCSGCFLNGSGAEVCNPVMVENSSRMMVSALFVLKTKEGLLTPMKCPLAQRLVPPNVTSTATQISVTALAQDPYSAQRAREDSTW